jgi:tRNA(His) 5'-end guanylyltransferase
MNFDNLDAKMRVFETALDQYILPDIHMVVRIDGRSFTRLTKDVHKFEAPFDDRFRDYMVETTRHLLTCGFRTLYGYTQSDEISLLLHIDESAFGRKIRKYESILAGEASAKFSLLLGDIGTFDSRISQLPTIEHVCDYFRWRQEDATRNALNAHCYWHLRKTGKSVKQATKLLSGMSVAAKNDLLFDAGINFNDLPEWQKRGVGVYWETFEKEAFNPKTGQAVTAERNRIVVNMELPIREDYAQMIHDIATKK